MAATMPSCRTGDARVFAPHCVLEWARWIALLLVPAAWNAVYSVEWKRLVPGTDARDSLVGLGMLAAWHLVVWVWGLPLLSLLGWETFEWPSPSQAKALALNAALASFGNFCFMVRPCSLHSMPVG